MKKYLINKNLEHISKINSKNFIHKPPVKIHPNKSIEFSNKNQLNMFPELIDECDGLCGI
jgi:hypothetical protein